MTVEEVTAKIQKSVNQTIAYFESELAKYREQHAAAEETARKYVELGQKLRAAGFEVTYGSYGIHIWRFDRKDLAKLRSVAGRLQVERKDPDTDEAWDDTVGDYVKRECVQVRLKGVDAPFLTAYYLKDPPPPTAKCRIETVTETRRVLVCS